MGYQPKLAVWIPSLGEAVQAVVVGRHVAVPVVHEGFQGEELREVIEIDQLSQNLQGAAVDDLLRGTGEIPYLFTLGSLGV